MMTEYRCFGVFKNNGQDILLSGLWGQEPLNELLRRYEPPLSLVHEPAFYALDLDQLVSDAIDHKPCPGFYVELGK